MILRTHAILNVFSEVYERLVLGSLVHAKPGFQHRHCHKYVIVQSKVLRDIRQNERPYADHATELMLLGDVNSIYIPTQ